MSSRYQALLKENPEPGTVMDRLWALHRSDPEELLEIYRSDDSAESRLILGHLLCKAGRAREGVIAFNEAAVLAPDDARVWSGMGEAWRLVSGHQQSAEAFEKALTISTNNGDEKNAGQSRLNAGQAWLDAGLDDRASAVWEAGLTESAEGLILRKKLAQIYLENDQPERAVPHLRLLLDKAEPDARPVFALQLAGVLESLGETDAAAAVLQRGLEMLAPGHWQYPQLQTELVRLFERSGRLDELQIQWEKEADAHPRDLGLTLRLAELCAGRDDAEGEFKWIEKALLIDPQNLDLHRRLSTAAMRRGDWDAALQAYQALQKFPLEQLNAIFGIASVELKRGNESAARKAIKSALAEHPLDIALRTRATGFFIENRMHGDAELMLRETMQASGETREDTLALAHFLFSKRRPEEARSVLRSLVKKVTPHEIAEQHFEIARLLFDEEEITAALEEVEEALSLNTDLSEAHILRARILAIKSDSAAALLAFRRGVETAEPARRLAAERLLFQYLAGLKPEPVEATQVEKSLLEMFAPEAPTPSTPAMTEALAGELEALSSHASKSANDSLRAARWYWWVRDVESAQRYAKQAIEIEASNKPARALLAEIARDTRQGDLAVSQLEELLALESLDSAERPGILRNIARVRAGQEDLDGAIQILEQLSRDHPGDLEILRDLALTQQQASLWYEALATWRQANKAAPPARKREFLDPLLRVMERLAMHTALVDTLDNAIAAENDQRASQAMMNDLLDYAEKHDLIVWIKTRFEARRRTAPDNFLYQSALATLLRREGKRAEALALLAHVKYSGANQEATLEQLVAEAESLGEFSLAIRFQRKLAGFSGLAEPRARIKLAMLFERNADIPSAIETWERLVRLNPRNPEVLAAASAFYERIAEPRTAMELWRKISVLEPENVEAFAAAGRLALEIGEEKSAVAFFENVLAQTTPVVGSIRIPTLKWQTERKRIAGDPAGLDHVEKLRLDALRSLAGIAPETAIASSVPDTEVLWTLLYAEKGEALFEKLDALIEADPANENLQTALVAHMLELREFERLAKWIGNDPERQSLLLLSLDSFLNASNAPWKSAEVNALLPDSLQSNATLWDATILFASHYRLSEAMQPGWRVFDGATSARPAFGYDMAKWLIILGRFDEARAMLLRSMEPAGAGFNSAHLHALIELLAVLPEKEKAELIANRLARDDLKMDSIHAACERTILHAVAGQKSEALENVRLLVDLRAIGNTQSIDTNLEEPAAMRYWRFLLASGIQLDQWNFPWLTMALWEHALEDEALIRLQGVDVEVLVWEVRLRTRALRLMQMRASDALREVEGKDYLELPAVTLSGLAALFERAGDLALAERMQSILHSRDPFNMGLLASRIKLCVDLGESHRIPDLMLPFLQAKLEDIHPNVLLPSVQAAVNALLAAGKTGEAGQIAEAACKRAPADLNSLSVYLDVLIQTGQVDLSLAHLIIENPAASPDHLRVAARALDAAGEPSEFLWNKLCKDSAFSDFFSGNVLVKYLLKNGHINRASIVCESMINKGFEAPMPQFADLFVKAGHPAQAVHLLRMARNKASQKALKLHLQKAIVDVLKTSQLPGFTSEHRLHKRMATDRPSDLLEYYQISATTAWDAEEEVLADWNEGQGSPAAGAWLLESAIERKDLDAVHSISRKLLAEEIPDEIIWAHVAGILEKSGELKMADSFVEQLCLMVPANDYYFLQAARLRRNQGEEAGYLEALRRLELRRSFSPDVTTNLAHFCARLGDAPTALKYFSMAESDAPRSRRGKVFLAHANFLLEQGDLPSARVMLRKMFQHPGPYDLHPVVEYLIAANRYDRLSSDFSDLDVSPDLVSEILEKLTTSSPDPEMKKAAAQLLKTVRGRKPDAS